MQFFGNHFRLRAFAGAWRTEQGDIDSRRHWRRSR
jgi:hypothetical protein